MSWVYYLDRKDQAFEILNSLYTKVLRSDREGEFVSKEFNIFYKNHAIHRELTTLYTQEQNDVAERKNRTIIKMAKNMLK